MRKLIIVFVFLIAYFNSLCAQLSIGNLTGSSLVENAVSDGIVVVKTDYQLQETETGNLFGKNGAEEYGSGYCLGVMTKSGIVMPEIASTPWLSDPTFERFKNDSQYKPVISHREYLSLDNKTVKECSDCSIELFEEGSFFLDRDSSNGFPLSDTLQSGDFHIVWFLQNQGKKLGEEGAVKVSVQTRKINTEEISQVRFQAPQLMQIPLGGYVFSCKTVGIGKLCFELVGVLEKQEEDYSLTLLYPIIHSPRTEPDVENEINGKLPDEDGSALTPIKKQGKSSKKNLGKDRSK